MMHLSLLQWSNPDASRVNEMYVSIKMYMREIVPACVSSGLQW